MCIVSQIFFSPNRTLLEASQLGGIFCVLRITFSNLVFINGQENTSDSFTCRIMYVLIINKEVIGSSFFLPECK